MNKQFKTNKIIILITIRCRDWPICPDCLININELIRSPAVGVAPSKGA